MIINENIVEPSYGQPTFITTGGPEVIHTHSTNYVTTRPAVYENRTTYVTRTNNDDCCCTII